MSTDKKALEKRRDAEGAEVRRGGYPRIARIDTNYSVTEPGWGNPGGWDRRQIRVHSSNSRFNICVRL
jgi:hypothetical protein